VASEGEKSLTGASRRVVHDWSIRYAEVKKILLGFFDLHKAIALALVWHRMTTEKLPVQSAAAHAMENGLVSNTIHLIQERA
jgi:hypothetical protein